jgi:glutamine cyclotransferase
LNLLYSEGWYGQSALGVLRVNPGNKTISQSQRVPINANYFGEGSTYFPKDGKTYMLTWKSNVLVVFD